MTLYFRIEPINSPAPSAGMFIVCWPEANGDGRSLHNAHPGRRVIDSEAGDVLVHRQRQERYRMLAVQRFSDWNRPWFASVPECGGA
jgi:hypothetical protein